MSDSKGEATNGALTPITLSTDKNGRPERVEGTPVIPIYRDMKDLEEKIGKDVAIYKLEENEKEGPGRE